MKQLFRLALFLVILSVLCSFWKKPEKAPRYVNKIEIGFYNNGQLQKTYHYTQPEKIASVLTCLRLLQPRGQQTFQESENHHSYRILLQYSDNTSREYLLHGYIGYSQNGSHWKRVLPSRAQLLYPLLQLLPEDE